MLINVFGKWINPDHISVLLNVENDCYIWINEQENNYIPILNKTADEVANEINRLVREQNND